MKLLYKIKNNEYENIKQVLKIEFNVSDRLCLRLKNNQRITLNGMKSNINTPVHKDDIIEIDLDFEEDNSNIIPFNMNIEIIYEDDSLLIINKPAGIATHPSCRHFDSSLSNVVRFYFDSINLKRKIRPVNRLDKDTSGLVIFAKNEYIQECLVRQMKSKIFKKEYIAFLEGHLPNKSRNY